MGLIAWMLDGEPIYCKVNPNFPRADGSTNDVSNRALREVLSYSGVDPDGDFVGFPQLFRGSGSPEGVITSPTGHLYFQDDGAVSSKLWIKGTGIGNTGWELINGTGGSVLTVSQLSKATPILDVWDVFPGVDDALSKLTRFGDASPGNAQFYDSSITSGTGSGAYRSHANGVVGRRYTAPVSSTAGSHSTVFGMPLSQKLNTAPAYPRTYRKYTYEVAFVIDVLGANNAFEVGIADSGSSSLRTVTTVRGIKVLATNGINSGLLYVGYRTTNGGALTTVNTALSPTSVHKATFIYTEGLTPTMEVQIDGASIVTVSGDANMWEAIAGASPNYYGLGHLNITLAGGGTSILDTLDAHYTVEEI